MYRQASRWERRIEAIKSAAKQGRFTTVLDLYPSERRKAQKLGFTVLELVENSSVSSPTIISWRKLDVFIFNRNNPILKYCLNETDEFPKTNSFAEECFIMTIKSFNLNAEKFDDMQSRITIENFLDILYQKEIGINPENHKYMELIGCCFF